jgi:anti-sigma factor RsiW
MTCDPKLLSYYRDGQLGMADRYEVECHLATCTQCTSDLRGLMRLAQTIRSLPMVPIDPRLGHELRQKIAEREAMRRERLPSGLGRIVAPVAVAASIAVSLVVSFGPSGLENLNPLAARAPASAPASVAIQPQAPPAGSDTIGPAASLNVQAPAAARPTVQPPIPRAGNPVATLGPQATDPTPVPQPIAHLYDSSRTIRDLLGEASPGSRTVTLLEQSFQGGLAIWRSDTRQIYVLRREGSSWSIHTDTWHPGDKISVDTAPPPGAMVPTGGFASVWRSTPDMQKKLGWAVYAPRGSAGLIQTFERGVVVWTPNGLLYVLSNDGRWRTFPDASPL